MRELSETARRQAGHGRARLFHDQPRRARPSLRLAEGGSRPADGLWIAWPKKASKLATDLDFDAVQQTGLAHGLVDNKSCAIDELWQALRFVYRMADR